MDPPQSPPRVLSGRYELAHLVARGGMAEVYRAHDRLLDRPVALKILFPELSVDRSFVERFKREAQAAANLSHPNIVPVFDWGEDSGTYFIVMEFIDGRALSSILRTAGPLHPDRAAEIGADVAAALAYAHRHGVIHRDVKPGNVLITDEGTVKVTDFGIARAINTEESLTQTGAVMGTATYFSPEQAEGVGVDARSDIYSLGVVLFEMVTGRPPFLGESPVAVASKHVRESPPAPHEINPSVPASFEAIIAKCMAKSPEFRYATGDDLRVDLLRFREGRDVQASVPATTQVVGPVDHTQALPLATSVAATEEDEPKSRTGLYVALLLVLLAALGVVVFFLGKSLGWWDSSSTTTFALPNVAGQTVTKATNTLEARGLKVTTKVDRASTAPTTLVVGTQPAQGTSVHRGETITLLTGSTPPAPSNQVKVPDLTTQSVIAAQQTLTADGLKSNVLYSANCSQVNIVCDQNPNGGTKITKGSTVTLFTAQPTTTTSTTTTLPQNVVVPNVQNQTPTQACATLAQNGLSCGSQTTQPDANVPAGEVISTSPAGGTTVGRNSTVNLIVSSGSPTSTTTSSVPQGQVRQGGTGPGNGNGKGDPPGRGNGH
ncbi:MAG TPA: Stk1 family PASTA domain-containing Ser/Thr kinase [Acidimicrobiales bacterium]|nr:Stk1 family PASTA domain-containing Ser/Thr kinase [Acidimicrobiales bacterium]